MVDVDRSEAAQQSDESSGPSKVYLTEPADRLPFGTPRKAARYRTERYKGATGRNWYTSDPSLQFLMRYHLTPDELAWAEPHLIRIGAIMGGPVSELAEQTDRNPPQLVRYDKWGHEISHVDMPRSFEESRRLVLDNGFGTPEIRQDARSKGVRLGALSTASSYMLDQADIGMACALGTGGGMVQALVAQYAPPDIRDEVLAKFASREWSGQSAQLLTERTGGSDLGQIETTATPHGDAWHLNGLKWFVSNVNGEAFVVLAKPEGAPDGSRGVCNFLVLKQRRDGTRNGVRIRRLKDKLGTKSVASAEVELVDAEAFLLGPLPGGSGGRDAGPSSGQAPGGLTQMMQLTNSARLGIALMGLGCARRSLVEALCYARAREAFGASLADQPLMRRKLAEMIVDVEAVQALVFDGHGAPNHQQRRTHRLRIGAPVIKLRAARLGITAAVDAIEVHGGNGYIETWPVARILRDAQVNTIWEGPDNILCLDVRRGIERDGADGPFLERLQDAVDVADQSDPTTRLVAQRVEHLRAAIEGWKRLDGHVAEARLFPLAQFMADVYAGALLVEQAGWETLQEGGDRKALVARLYADRYLADPGPFRGITDGGYEALERFDDLSSGAFVDEDEAQS